MTEKKRHPQSLPDPKSQKTVTFVNPNGPNEAPLEVISTVSKAELRILKKRGYVQASKILAPNKDTPTEDEEEDDTEDDEDEEDSTPPAPVKKAAPQKATARAR